MPIYSIGKIITSYRVQRGISQQELCEGICSLPTLSRIESCKQNPSKVILEALLSKLGVDVGVINVGLQGDEYNRYVIESTIQKKIHSFNFEYWTELNLLWDGKSDIKPLDKQFYLYAKALAMYGQKSNLDDVEQTLVDALKISFADFSLNVIPKRKLYTSLELSILHSIAIVQIDKKEFLSSMQYLLFLQNYYDTNSTDALHKAFRYPFIIYQLSSYMLDSNNLEEAYRLCKTGMRTCFEHNNMHIFLLFLQNVSVCQKKMGLVEDSKKTEKHLAQILEDIQYQGPSLILENSDSQTLKDSLFSNNI